MRTLLIIPALLTSTGMAVGQSIIRFSNITELGVGFQVGSTQHEVKYTNFLGTENTVTTDVEAYQIPSPRLMTSFGIMVWELFYLGAGVGYQFQAKEDPLPYQHHVAGFGQARIHFAKGRFRPFTDLRVGYNYTLNENTNDLLSSDTYKWDGLLIEPSLGIAFKMGEKALFNLGLAYQFLRTDQRETPTVPLLWTEATATDRQHRLVINLGFTFK